MHFVISVFAAVCLYAILILFVEVTPKWFQICLTIGAGLCSAYGLAIGIRKIAIMSKAFKKPALMSTFYSCAGVVAVLTILVYILIKRKSKKQ